MILCLYVFFIKILKINFNCTADTWNTSLLWFFIHWQEGSSLFLITSYFLSGTRTCCLWVCFSDSAVSLLFYSVMMGIHALVKKLIRRQVESLWDSTQKRMRVRSSSVSLQTCLVNKCYPYSITNIHFIQEVCHQTFMCQCLYTLASLTLQGCRAAGLDFSEGASSAATSLVVHVKIVWHLWGTASSVDSIVWSYFDSLENCHKGLLSGDSGHVGAEEPAWSLLELGCRRPRGRASKQGCC